MHSLHKVIGPVHFWKDIPWITSSAPPSAMNNGRIVGDYCSLVLPVKLTNDTKVVWPMTLVSPPPSSPPSSTYWQNAREIIGSVLLTYRTSSQSSAETSASLRELWVSSLPLFPSGPLFSHKGSASLNMVQRVCVSLRWPASRHEMLRPEPQGKRSECVDALGAKRLASARSGGRRQSTCGTLTSVCSAAAHAKLRSSMYEVRAAMEMQQHPSVTSVRWALCYMSRKHQEELMALLFRFCWCWGGQTQWLVGLSSFQNVTRGAGADGWSA